MNSRYQPAVLTAFTTFLLIGLGGLVTSHEAGMSVPDWPTSYGYNMFVLPIQFWQGGVIYEHTHRLMASFLGVLVVALARWLGGNESRKPLAIVGSIEVAAGILIFLFFPNIKAVGHFLIGIGVVVLLAAIVWVRNTPFNSTLVWCGWVAFVLVQLQGLLGGLRVALYLDWLGVPHGAIAQAFLILIAAIALFTSRWWLAAETKKQISVPRGLRRHVFYLTLLIFVQLLIAATIRHQHAGLAIWDFPAAHGKIWPDTTPAAIADYNAHRPPGLIGRPITAFQVNLQMVHRLVAYAIFLGVAALPFLARKKLGGGDWLAKFSWFWLALLAGQIGLGAATVLSNKAADVTTAHVMVGALALLTGAVWWLVAARRTRRAG
jgi:cytochrome c oxidase assembly protein subunit 15